MIIESARASDVVWSESTDSDKILIQDKPQCQYSLQNITEHGITVLGEYQNRINLAQKKVSKGTAASNQYTYFVHISYCKNIDKMKK